MTREERVSDYYDRSASELANLLVDTEEAIQFLLDSLYQTASLPESTGLVSAQKFCRNLLDDYLK